MKKVILVLAATIMTVSSVYADPEPDILKRANSGDAEAQYQVGLYFFQDKIMADALEWFTKAANQNHVPAQNNLGLMYDYGMGVPQDYAKAFEWYIKAANKGNTHSQTRLGFIYINGKLTGKPDKITGCAWTYLAKGQNDRYCDSNLDKNEMTAAMQQTENFRSKIQK